MSVDFEVMRARKSGAPAVVLLSGGLDSATVLAIAKKLDYAVYALSFRYGQRHSSELDAATQVAKSLGAVEHQIIDLDLRRFVGGSALTDDAYDVPTSPTAKNEIPITYVPARNTIMLSVALGWAEALGGLDIFFGANAVDTRVSAASSVQDQFSNYFNTKDNWNIIPSLSYLNVSKYAGDNFSFGVTGSINKMSKFVNKKAADGTYSVVNPGDYNYYGVDLDIK